MGIISVLFHSNLTFSDLRKVLISEDLDEPRSIVLDLETGWMFWSDWGKKPRIERAWMDGTNREIIIDTELVW